MKVSAIFIILIGIFVFVDKIRSLTKKEHEHHCGCGCCNHEHNHEHNPTSSKKNEWLIALSASIIPCPGTIIIFILAFELGSYFASFISAVFMSLGMSAVIFISALLGLKLSQKLQNIRIYVEFFGIFVILALGIVMFLLSNKMGVL